MTRSMLLAGLATLGIAGAALAAGEAKLHTLNVALPDGSVAQIHYVGDVAPKVVVAEPTVPVALMAGDPFAEFDRISAAMDAQAEAMMQQAGAMMQAAPATDPRTHQVAANAAAPQGSYSYTYVSTTGPGAAGACTQSYRMTSFAAGEAPKVESQQSGDCKNVAPLVPAAVTGAPAATPQPTPAAAPKPAAPKADLRGTI